MIILFVLFIMKKQDYGSLITDIGEVLGEGRRQTYFAVNSILVKTYWEIGRRIVEYEQKGYGRAGYGENLLANVSHDLKMRYGKGFSRSNLQYMRLLYIKYPKCQTLSGKLNWSHYVELLMVTDDLERGFYEKQCINEGWSNRELKRQKDSALFTRIALSKNKKEVLTLSKKGHLIEKAEDIIKDPYILEFLNIPQNPDYSEKMLEDKIIDNLKCSCLNLVKDSLLSADNTGSRLAISIIM